jgi:anti-anti-sigma regulatory factor
MLRITQIGGNGQGTLIRLEGQVAGAWVPELERLCEQALAEGSRLTLDLSQVSFLDVQGVSLIRELAARQAQIQNCSPFVAELLKGELP